MLRMIYPEAVLAGGFLLACIALGLSAGVYKSLPAAGATTDLGGLVMAKLNELAEQLNRITAQLEKARVEVVERVNALVAALEDVGLPAEAEAALEALKAKAQELDDLNPDATEE